MGNLSREAIHLLRLMRADGRDYPCGGGKKWAAHELAMAGLAEFKCKSAVNGVPYYKLTVQGLQHPLTFG